MKAKNVKVDYAYANALSVCACRSLTHLAVLLLTTVIKEEKISLAFDIKTKPHVFSPYLSKTGYFDHRCEAEK